MSAQWSHTPASASRVSWGPASARAGDVPHARITALGAVRARVFSSLPIAAALTLAAFAVAQLLLGVALAAGAFEADGLKTQATALERQQAAAKDSLEAMRSPQYIAANAAAMGMVPSNTPAYLRLSDRAVLGVATAARPTNLNRARVPNALLSGVPLVTQHNTGRATVTEKVRPSGVSLASLAVPGPLTQAAQSLGNTSAASNLASPSVPSRSVPGTSVAWPGTVIPGVSTR